MDNRPIGVFDSGVGGLSILLETQKELPNESFVFVADQAYVPYGAKTKSELLDRVSRLISFLQTHNVKAVVMACNTATVYTIKEMREQFAVPIIGTVPVVKTLANISKTRKAAVFSTPATAKSEYLAKLIADFAPDMEVITVGGSNLEELVEDGQTDTPAVKAILEELLPPLIAQGVDAVALGCTHYPFVRAEVERVVGPEVMVVDSGGAVARRVAAILTTNNQLADTRTGDLYFTTGDATKFHRAAEKLMQQTLLGVTHINV